MNRNQDETGNALLQRTRREFVTRIAGAGAVAALGGAGLPRELLAQSAPARSRRGEIQRG